MKLPITKNSSLFISVLLASLAALAPFAIDTYLPAFSVLETSFNTTPVALQHSLTFYLLPYAIMTLWHGAISDSIGRITTIKWGLGIFVIASIGCAFAENIETLLFFRVLQGLSGGAGNVVARAMVRDLYEGPEAQRVMANVQIMFGVAPAVAPIIGGLLLGIHWKIIFIFLAFYAVVALFAANRYLPETMPPIKRLPLSAGKVLKNYRILFSDTEYLLLIISISANFAGFFLYVVASPVFLMAHLGLSDQQFGFLFIPTVCGMVLGSYLAKLAAGKYARRKVVVWAYVWMSLTVVGNVVACFALSNSVWLILPIAIFNVGMSLAMPILSIAALDRHPKIRGTAASGQAFCQMLMASISAGLVAPLMWNSPLQLSFGMSGFLLVGWVAIRGSCLWREK